MYFLKWEPTLSLCNFLAGATCPHISLVVQSRAGWETVCRVAMAEVAEINPLHFSYFCKDWDRGLELGAYYPLWVLAEIPASGEAQVNTFIFHCIVVFFNMEHLLAVYLLRLADDDGRWSVIWSWREIRLCSPCLFAFQRDVIFGNWKFILFITVSLGSRTLPGTWYVLHMKWMMDEWMFVPSVWNSLSPVVSIVHFLIVVLNYGKLKEAFSDPRL